MPITRTVSLSGEGLRFRSAIEELALLLVIFKTFDKLMLRFYRAMLMTVGVNTFRLNIY